MPIPLQLETHTPENFGPLAQIGQKYKNYFSFARKKGHVVHALHPGVLCRDYLIDQLLWMREDIPFTVKVYGFVKIEEANPKYPELYFSGATGFLETNLPGLHEIETKLNISLTEIDKVGEGYYIKADPWWYTSTLHWSWYTQALRQMGAVKINWEAMDQSADGAFSRMGKLLGNFPFVLKEANWSGVGPKTREPFLLHDQSGMLTVWSWVCYYKYSMDQIQRQFTWTQALCEGVRNGN